MKLLLVIAVLAACGGGGSGGSVSVDQLPAENARVLCGKLDECCTLEEFMDETLGSENVTECQGVFTAFSQFLVTILNDSIAKGRAVYHADRMADCYAVLEGASCVEFQSMDDVALADCENPIDPKVADGGQCGEDFDCTSGLCDGEAIDFETMVITYGVCAAAPGSGQPCVDRGCARGLYCNSDTLCATPQPDGADCLDEDECASGGCTEGICGAIMTCNGK